MSTGATSYAAGSSGRWATEHALRFTELLDQAAGGQSPPAPLWRELRRAPGGLLIADVIRIVERICRTWGARPHPDSPVPAVMLAETWVPFLEPAGFFARYRSSRRASARMHPRELLVAFPRNVQEFITSRLHGAAGKGGEDEGPDDFDPERYQGSVPGMSVEVHCNNRGYVVESSPRFAGNFTFFGAPTTPAYGMLDPGTYCFSGAPKTGGPAITDGSVYDIARTPIVTVRDF